MEQLRKKTFDYFNDDEYNEVFSITCDMNRMTNQDLLELRKEFIKGDYDLLFHDAKNDKILHNMKTNIYKHIVVRIHKYDFSKPLHRLQDYDNTFF